MPEDVTRDLKAFTPVVPDRDALLFAAGKAAARRWSGWKWLTLALTVTNAVTLGVLLWPRTAASVAPVVNPELPLTEPPPSLVPEPYSYIALRQGWDTPPKPTDSGPASPPAAPLTPRSLSDPRFN